MPQGVLVQVQSRAPKPLRWFLTSKLNGSLYLIVSLFFIIDFCEVRCVLATTVYAPQPKMQKGAELEKVSRKLKF